MKESPEARFDTDTAPLEEQPERNRLSLSSTLHGRVVLHGDFDAPSGELLLTAPSKLSAPRPAADGTRDPRSASQRRADACIDMVRRYLCAGITGEEAAERPHLTVVIRDSDLRRQQPRTTYPTQIPRSLPELPLPYMPWTGTLTPRTARQLACDAQITALRVDDHDVPLAMGRTTRLVTAAQRKALGVRDKGCAFPGCGAPLGWTEAHHIHHWADGGPTDLDNLVLLCSHHRHLHHTPWTVHLDHGIPWFTPPPTPSGPSQPIPAHGREPVGA